MEEKIGRPIRPEKYLSLKTTTTTTTKKKKIMQIFKKNHSTNKQD